LDTEILDFKKLNNVELKEDYEVKISSRFATLRNLNILRLVLKRLSNLQPK